MSELNYFRIAQLLGGTLTKTVRPEFGGFSAAAIACDRLRLLTGEDVHDAVPRELFPDLAAAFEKVRNGYELDRVLVDPVLRPALLNECKQRGITQSPRAIFKRLQFLRKSSSYGVKLERTTRDAGLDPEPFFYAAELGYVQLSYLHDASVDDVITIPEIGEAFDDVCRKLAPNGTSMEFRWAALRLRKMRSFTPAKVESLLAIAPSRIEQKLEHRVQLSGFQPASLPEEEGVFSFTEPDDKPRYLYVGSTKSLRAGVEPFKGAEPFRRIADSYWTPALDRIELHFGVIKGKWMGASARDLGLRLIRDRHPLFNVPVDFERGEAA